MSLVNTVDNATRVSLLKKIIKIKGHVRAMEVHNGLSGLIVNDLCIPVGNKGKLMFDALWESSFTDSASKGLPDIEIVSLDSRLETIRQILEVTKKPMIVDGDTGGDLIQFEYMVRRLERVGVSMVVIEDKIFPKRNSLDNNSQHFLEEEGIFAAKIRAGVKMKLNPDFMIVVRLESLIAGGTINEALDRAKIFLEAGADGILIHSNKIDPDCIIEFADKFYLLKKSIIKNKVLVCVPTRYNSITDDELVQAGFNIIIHANHMLRASYMAMERVAQAILINDRSLESDKDCASIEEIFEKVGFFEVTRKDRV